MIACRDINGVLPILTSSSEFCGQFQEPPWYATPLGTPLDELRDRFESLRSVVELCLSIATTVSKMHDRGYSHRDLKPGNIIKSGSIWCVADFGLVDFPEKRPVTKENGKLGPAYYIAPEMLNDAQSADGKSADVYSLAKLLWTLATDQKYPLPGHHLADFPALTISSYVSDRRAVSLDRVLEIATHVDAHKRIRMSEFASLLSDWLNPPVIPRTFKDLEELRRKVLDLTESETRRKESNKARAEKIHKEIKRAAKKLEKHTSFLQNELGRASLNDAWTDCSYSDTPKIRTPNYFDKQLFGEDEQSRYLNLRVSLHCTISRKQTRMRLEARFGLWICVEGSDANLDATAFVNGAHILWRENFDPECDPYYKWLWKTNNIMWSNKSGFIFRSPNEMPAFSGLFSDSLGQLNSSTRKLLETFEELLETPDTGSGGRDRV